MSCYKCHTDHYRIYFNHHHTFLIASFFLLLTFFILNRNSFTFGSFTLVTGILKYSFPFFVLKHNYYFGFLVLLRLAWLWLWRLQWAAVMMEERGKKWDFLSIFWCFFFHLSRHQRDHINLNTFWQCTAKFTSDRRVIEEHISSHFSFSLFLFFWNCFTFCLN